MIETTSRAAVDRSEKQAEYLRACLKDLVQACGVEKAHDWGDGMLVGFLRGSPRSPFVAPRPSGAE